MMYGSTYSIGGAYSGGLSAYRSGYTPAMPYSGALGSSVPIYRGPSTVQTARPLSFGSTYVQPASAYPTTYFTAPQAIAAPARAVGAASATVNNPLRIGATIPNFHVKTTKGEYDLHDFLLGDEAKPWTILFSHPNDFTPVCTTELGACHGYAAQFAKLGVKMIGLSCDETESHHAWSKDVLHRVGKASDESLAFPLIADSDRKIVSSLGMLDPEEVTA